MNGCKPAVAFLEKASGSSGAGGSDGGGDDDGGESPIADMSIFDGFKPELDALAPDRNVRVYMYEMETTRTLRIRPDAQYVESHYPHLVHLPPRPRPGRSALLLWLLLPGNYPESLLLPVTAADDSFLNHGYD